MHDRSKNMFLKRFKEKKIDKYHFVVQILPFRAP